MGEVTRLGKLRELQAPRPLPVAGGAVLIMVCLPKTSLGVVSSQHRIC